MKTVVIAVMILAAVGLSCVGGVGVGFLMRQPLPGVPSAPSASPLSNEERTAWNKYRKIIQAQNCDSVVFCQDASGEWYSFTHLTAWDAGLPADKRDGLHAAEAGVADDFARRYAADPKVRAAALIGIAAGNDPVIVSWYFDDGKSGVRLSQKAPDGKTQMSLESHLLRLQKSTARH